MVYDKIEKKKISDKFYLKKCKEVFFYFFIFVLVNDDMVIFFDMEVG